LFADAAIPPGFSPGDTALVGVSGGRDSVALLHWLRAQGWPRLIVCHLDHGLRAESRAEANFVRELAAKWKCECDIARAGVAAQAQRKKLSIEAAAREARHRFFARCARTHGTDRLFLAHHADDQVETFLFNLLRGAGVGGLGGMPAVTTIGKLRIARPLLGVWREEIDAYCAAHALTWKEDASNASREHTRNRLRHDALPALSAAMGRDVRRALWRTAEILRAEDELFAVPVTERDWPNHLSVSALRDMPVALQRRMLQSWLLRQGVIGIGFEEVERVRAMLTTTRLAKVNLPGGRHARRRSGQIFCE
jgi:tRNA(Ile)-lysidine synthase